MKNRKVPSATHSTPPRCVESQVSVRALERWTPVQAAADGGETDNTISVYEPIGYDPWTGGGVTAKRISSALRSIGKGDVTVNINSPGGDMFEGLAIYNLLRDHPGAVTVKVIGLAASAASIIAMAGDEVQIARAGFFMVHNSWIIAIGNRHDMRAAADFLEPFDRTMADIYAARTGADIKAMQKLMDAETFIGGSDAVDQGFADNLLPADQVTESTEAKAHAARRIEALCRQGGLSRVEAGRLFRDLTAGLSDSAPQSQTPRLSD